MRAFHKAEKALADTLGLTGEDRKRAGATIVGRFRDGTALTAHSTALGETRSPTTSTTTRTRPATAARFTATSARRTRASRRPAPTSAST